METSTKIAVITGPAAASGGGQLRSRFTLGGFSVALAGRRREMLEETATLAKASPPRMLVVPTDVSDPAAIAALLTRSRRRTGRIDLLFNNAGAEHHATSRSRI